MNDADDIRRVFQQAGLGLDPDADERLFQDVLQARRQTPQNPRTAFDRWRMIVENPLTKVAVAAAVVVAGAIGVSLWKQTGSGLALADVLARLEQVQAYRLKMSTTFQMGDTQSKPMAESTMLVSRSLGQKVVMQLNHPITGQSMVEEIYVLPHERNVITLMPNEKQYSKIDLDDASLEQWQQESGSPQQIVERVLKSQHTDLGPSVVDGVAVEGFQTTDPNCLGEPSAMGADIHIWVDVGTRLPVRIEIDKSIPGKGCVHAVVHDFEWDVPVDAAEFVAVIPDDYAPGQPMIQIRPRK